MRNHIYVRPLRLYDEEDKAAFVSAADASGKEFPRFVFTLPTTRIMVAEMGSEIVMYQPQFVSLNFGSLIPNGKQPDTLMASAQHQLLAAAYTRAHSEGLADIFTLSNNAQTRKLALRHGFIERLDAMRLEIR